MLRTRCNERPARAIQRGAGRLADAPPAGRSLKHTTEVDCSACPAALPRWQDQLPLPAQTLGRLPPPEGSVGFNAEYDRLLASIADIKTRKLGRPAATAKPKTLLSNLWKFARGFEDFDGGDRPNPMRHGDIDRPYVVGHGLSR